MRTRIALAFLCALICFQVLGQQTATNTAISTRSPNSVFEARIDAFLKENSQVSKAEIPVGKKFHARGPLVETFKVKKNG